jgi:hypothetical protein
LGAAALTRGRAGGRVDAVSKWGDGMPTDVSIIFVIAIFMIVFLAYRGGQRK